MADIFYHVTPTAKLNRILAEGLTPKRGPRSKRAKETEEAVYFFPTKDDLEAGMDSWVFDYFPEEARLTVLEVTLPEGTPVLSAVGWERHVLTTVPPECLRVLTRDIGAETGYGFIAGEETGANPGMR